MNEVEVITELYHGAWNDFLSNKRQSAVTRASAALKRIQHVETLEHVDCEVIKDLLITKADLLHIQGASESDDRELLSHALATYNQYLKVYYIESTLSDFSAFSLKRFQYQVVPDSRNATRMKAETQLRLHDYDAAWATFDKVASLAALVCLVPQMPCPSLYMAVAVCMYLDAL